MTEPAVVLVVEDDAAQREQLCGFLANLEDPALVVREAADASAARAVLDAGGVDVVLTDLMLGGDDGLDLLRFGHAQHPLVDFVVLTAYGSVETAVEAMRHGAHDFLTKPIDLDILEQRLRRLLEKRGLAREVRHLRERLAERVNAAGVVAESPGMQRVLSLVRKVAPTTSTVLVTGESGTGKELVADLLHAWSPRSSGPLLRVNCGALTESLLESELFGHVRGAFTGADRDRPGLFVEADGGTLFLDEIGEVSPGMQVRLLRVLQEREVRAVGAATARSVDVRIVAATNRDLAREVEAGRFRSDLLFRINVIGVHIPPLRERPEDVSALIPLFLRRYAEQMSVPVPRLSREAHDLLMGHPFPGNVRELQNVLERAVILSQSGVIDASDLPDSVRSPTTETAHMPSSGRSLPELVAALEQRAIRRALSEHGGVRARAARALGLPERVLRYKLKGYGIDPTKLSGSRQDRRPEADAPG